jgi:hypothetical protein
MFHFQNLKSSRALSIAFALAVSLGIGGYSTLNCSADSHSDDSSKQQTGVWLKDHGDRVSVEINGKLFTEYHYKTEWRPYLYPLIGPGDARMTRDWPMAEAENDAKDHPHHRSLWYSHGEVNGIYNFWHEDKKTGGHIRHQKFLKLCSGEDKGVIQALNQWIGHDGKLVCEEVRTLTFYNTCDSERVLDFDITFNAIAGDLTFGDTKEGTMGIRLAPTMRLKGEVGQGHIINSAGDKDGNTWGKRAAWCDYYGPVNNKIVGVAIFDHPENPRHPTWWHVRDYGLFAANAFGTHYFENLPAGEGNYTIKSNQQETWKYRFYIHQGDNESAHVSERYEEYSSK